jgi:hypothetical protein
MNLFETCRPAALLSAALLSDAVWAQTSELEMPAYPVGAAWCRARLDPKAHVLLGANTADIDAGAGLINLRHPTQGEASL